MNCRSIPASLLGALLFSLSLIPSSARAATWTVTTNGDDSGAVACTANACPTLRDAISSASPGDSIQLAGLGGAIALTGPVLRIDNDVTITGPGANKLAVQGSGSTVFEIVAANVTISGLTVTDGDDQTNGGGGILVDKSATLSLESCAVTNNATNGTNGGGIDNLGTLNLLGSTVADNQAIAVVVSETGSGGVSYGGGNGGGIENDGTMTAVNSTIAGNFAEFGDGGGIDNTGSITLTNVTVVGNLVIATITSGGPYSPGYEVGGVGGGIYSSGLNGSGAGTAEMLNTIVDGNTAPTDNDVNGTYDQSGTTGHNLIGPVGDAAGFSSARGDQIGAPIASVVAIGDVPQYLGSTSDVGPELGNNGGPTQTVALIPGSPAIDAGDDAVAGAPYNLATDQRGPGFPRWCGQHVDIGAFEYFVPSVGTLSPTEQSTVEGTPSTWSATYTDSGGYGLLSQVQICVGSNGYPSSSLYAEYLPNTNLLYLFDSSNVAVGGFAPGSNHVITTPLGSLNCAQTSVSGVGNNLTVKWSIVPSTALLGLQSVYLQAADVETTTNWSKMGSWTIVLSGPSVVALAPTSLNSRADSENETAATYGDGAGYTALTKVQICVGAIGAPATSLYAEYLPATNLLYLFNASNVAIGGFAPGSNHVITTGLGSLNCARVTVSGSGDWIVVRWSITPAKALEGTPGLYLQAADAGTTTSWYKLGTWTVTPPIPSTISLTPTSLSTHPGTESALTATYADGAGYAALTKVQLCVGSVGYPSTSLYAEYLPATNLLYLFNASDVAVGGFAPGSANVITTPLGSLDCAKTTVTGGGTNLTVVWSLTPAATLDGVQGTYLQASDGGSTTNWTEFGTWTITTPVPSVGSLTPTSVSTSAGSESALIASYADGNGYPALTKVQVCVGGLTYPSTSLYAEYLPATNLLYLFNANNVAVGGFAPGSANVITTPLGSLDCARTAVTGSGNKLVVVWYLTPLPALIGSQAIYLDAQDSERDSGWSKLGAWTIAGDEISGQVTQNGVATPGVTVNLTGTATASAVTDAHGDYAFANLLPGGYTVAPAAQTGIQYQLPSQNVPLSPGLQQQVTVNFAGGTPYTISGQVLSYANGGATSGVSGVTVTAYVSPATNEFIPVTSAVTNSSGAYSVTVPWGTYQLRDGLAGAPFLGENYYSATVPVSGTGGPDATLNFADYQVSGSVILNGVPTAGVSVNLSVANYASETAITDANGNYDFSLIDPLGYYQLTAVSTPGYLTTLNNPSSVNVSLPTTGITGISPNFTDNFTGTRYPSPANDDFSNAEPISQNAGNVIGNTGYSTLEPGEPNPTFLIEGELQNGADSVWYKFVAPGNNEVGLTLTLSTQQIVNLYSGGSLTSLNWIAGGAGGAGGPISPGATYYVQVMDPLALDEGPRPEQFTMKWATYSVPANDNFANATVLSAQSGLISGSTLASTLQPLEPTTTGGDSVWYEYTAPTSSAGMLVLGTQPLQFDEAYFTGSALSNLQQVGSGPALSTSPGTRYYIQISSATATGSGPFSLQWTWSVPTPTPTPTATPTTPPVPPNDDFAQAQNLPGTSGSVSGTTLGATVETGEPNALKNSVWYMFTAPSTSSGCVTFGLSNNVYQNIYVYTGSSLTNLTEQADFYQGLCDTTPGTTYYFQVENITAGPANFILNWAWTATPSNDNFANATAISGISGQVTGTTVGATIETGERNCYEDSVWYRYTAPSTSNGFLTLGLSIDNQYYGSLFIYTGSSLANLAGIYGPTFATTPGASYYIQVGNLAAPFTLQWSWTAAVSNDNFANAEAISGPYGSLIGTTVGATVESGEPNAQFGTVWYCYTAPSGSTGAVSVLLNSGQLINFYTGTAFTNLIQIPTATNQNGLISIPTAPGGVYYFQVEAPSARGSEIFTLEWNWAVPPPNDSFAQAQAIGGLSGSVNGTTDGSGGEPNDSPDFEAWYAYTTPSNASGPIEFTATSTQTTSNPNVSVYTGDSVGTLSYVAYSYTGSLSFTPVPGTTYYLAILDGTENGDYTLSWSYLSAPANDNFANAQALTGASGSVQGTTVNSTIEPGDPNAAGADNSVWYAYTDSSATGGSVTLTAPGSGNAICVYTGTSLANLTELAGGYDLVNFTTSPGVTYYIEVMSPHDYVAPFSLAWSWTANPGTQSSGGDIGANLALPAKKPSGHAA